MSERWSVPDQWPPHTSVPNHAEYAFIGDGVIERVCPFPVYEVEVGLIDRPSSTKLLPIHPMGKVELYGHSRAAAMSLVGPGDFPSDQVKALVGLIGEKCRSCYMPGHPVRDTFEQLVESASKISSSNRPRSAEELLLQRLEYLAITCVLQGLDRWTENGASDDAA